MAEVCLPAALSSQVIDVCTCCQIVWFDAHEYERVPAAPMPPKTFMSSLPPEARERYALMEVDAIWERYDREEKNAPDATWKYIPALFGLPVEYAGQVENAVPWVTWSLASLIAVVSLAAFSEGEAVFRRFGLIPAECLRDGGLTFITSLFLHGGFAHLLGNMYFLVVFGDNVEEVLGKARYALLFLLAALAGGLAHVLGDMDAAVPCVGASGAISGIIAYYALAFPHARLGWMLRWGVVFKWVNLSSRVMFLLWLAFQLLGVWMQRRGFSQVSALAHMGGVAVGALFWAVDAWRDRDRVRLRVPTRAGGA
jgi:membrane associated rhomboid family serine protease